MTVKGREQKKVREARQRGGRAKAIVLDDLFPRDDPKGGAGRPALIFGQIAKAEREAEKDK